MSATTPDSETDTFRQLQDQYEDFYVPQFTVTVADQTFSETDAVVSDISVDLALDKASKFSFTLNYPYDHEHGQFEGLDWELFAPDQAVSIRMGYGGTENPILHEGRITAVRPSFPSGNAPTVTVDGFGLLHTMSEPPEPPGDQETWTHTWNETPPHEVVEHVVDERNYDFGSVETVEAGVAPQEIKQDESDHDLQFLLKLGTQYAYELYAWEGDLYFQPPRYDGPPDLVLNYGTSLDSFSPEVNEAGQVDRVEVRNWSAEQGEEIVGVATREGVAGTASGSSGQETTETLRLPVRTTTEATARAEAVLANRLDGTVSGKGECIGLPEIRPGMRMQIEGLTDQFTSVYYVDSATHRFGGSGYQTSFGVKRREL